MTRTWSLPRGSRRLSCLSIFITIPYPQGTRQLAFCVGSGCAIRSSTMRERASVRCSIFAGGRGKKRKREIHRRYGLVCERVERTARARARYKKGKKTKEKDERKLFLFGSFPRPFLSFFFLQLVESRCRKRPFCVFFRYQGSDCLNP
jgi:hypothetical protein